jgi:putative phosphoribosyl transferase
MFRDRIDAGRRLAEKLTGYANRPDVLVLGVPRGGMIVAFEVAHAVRAALDVLIVRKLGTPGQKELAMGAIASGGACFLNRQLIAELGIVQEQIAGTIAEEEVELRRREQLYRGLRPAVAAVGRTVILVDDGIATGSSMLVAIHALRTLEPKKIVAAVPVAPFRAAEQIGRIADEFICVVEPEWFFAIGEFYESFPQTSDSEVRLLIQRAARPLAGPEKAPDKDKERGAA